MRPIQITLLLLLLIAFGCTEKEQLILYGKLGNKLESTFKLDQHGDKFSGYFIYENNESKKIAVTGVRTGNSLRINEFNNDENKLTGTFEGKYDGAIFQGYWEDPEKTKKIPFLYTLVVEKEENQYEQEGFLSPKKINIEYLTFENFGGDFYYRLEAKIGEKKYKLTDFNDGHETFVRIIDVRDFDNDGYDDALIGETCGGTACPFSSLFFCSYDKEKDKFKVSESFGSISDNPKIEKWKGKWSVSITSFAVMQIYRADERYIYENKEPIRVEYNEAQALKALEEMRPEDFSEYEKQNGKILKYDLDGDGRRDSIIGEYWDRWDSINWEIKFADGKYFDGGGTYQRIGILSSKTKGVHDLVCELDDVFVWNGKKYRKK